MTRTRKSHRASPRRKARKSQRKTQPMVVWYHEQPRLNSKLETLQTKVQLDDDDEWLLTGMTNSASIPRVKKWVNSLGKTTKVQVGH